MGQNMKTLQLKHDYKTSTAKLRGRHPDPSHADKIVRGNTVVIAPDGQITAVLIKRQIAPALCNRAYELWKMVQDDLSNRATAIGAPSLLRPRMDGSLSERKGVPKNVLEVLEKQGAAQGVLGFLDATADGPCHKTPLSKNRPDMLDRNEVLIKRVDELYAQHLPTPHARQMNEVAKVPRWRLWGTAFTTVYIVKNLRCAYHTDSGNLRGVMSAIISMGEFTGGELVLPRWRIAIAFKPGDLLLFDPQQLHGNLPFSGERLSAIFYCERRISDCGE
jgi:hypothetical protein